MELIMLRVSNIKKSFGGLLVIDNVSLTVGRGEFVSLLGVSGSGKTTLFNIIAGLSRPDSGQVFLDGREITNTTGHIAYMQQDDMLLPWKTIIDNVALPLAIKGMGRAPARRKAAGYFELFGLSGFERCYPDELSGGMRQRAALLRTHLFSGGAALLDEPFARLDAITRNKMRLWLSDVISQIKCGVLFITHDVDEALLLSDRVYVLSDKPAAVRMELEVDLGAPKTIEITTSPKFNELKRKILKALG